MAGYIGTKAVLLSTTAADVAGTLTADAGQFDTSLNVDGTVTADGLTVGGNILRDVDNNSMFISGGNAAATGANIGLYGSTSGNSNDILLRRDNVKFAAFDGATGDVSFYEDTGTTAKFFWDASAESLGIGTSSPKTNLDLSSSTGPQITLTRSDATNSAGDTLGRLNFYNSDPSGDGANNAAIIEAVASSGTGADANLLFRTKKSHVEGADAAESMRIDQLGNVGIGASDVDSQLHIEKSDVTAYNGSATDGQLSAGATAFVQQTGGSNSALSQIVFQPRSGFGYNRIVNSGGSVPYMAFATNNSEAMRIDDSGNLLVGKTVADNTTQGVTIYGPSASMSIARSGASQLILNRLSSDGDMAVFRKDGTTVGSIGSRSAGSSTVLYIGFSGSSSDVGLTGTTTSAHAIIPCENGSSADNIVDLGVSSVRFDDIYATNGTIQTSDRNEKQDIASLTPTEMLVAARLSTGFKNFRWKDSVAEKGAAARMHSGIIAQDVQDAFTAEGLDAGDYAMFISGTWWEQDVDVPAVEAVAEVVDEDGVVVTEAVEAVAAYTRTDTYDTEAEAPVGAVSKTRLGVRYPELLSFVAAYNEQRFASIEARLTALEAV